MTKANILKKYFKKFYNLDLTGMSLAEVLKQFMKAQYDFDSKGSGVVSIVQEMIDNNLAPEGGSGGDDGTMVVRCETDTDAGRITLLKTWQEMHDAYDNGEMIIIDDPSEGVLKVKSFTTEQDPETGEMVYVVIVLTRGHTMYYTAPSPTDRPFRLNLI